MSDKKSFFVGYLPMPASLKKYYWVVAVALVSASLGFGYWVASSQHAAGHGEWKLSEEKTYRGYLSHAPYPVLHTIEKPPESVLLVMQGKHSSSQLSAALDGQEVSVTGVPIERGGWKMLELRDESDIEVHSIQGEIAQLITSLGDVVLKGEIIDSKCFLGVMKPGAGKVHRACAAMCIAGGMPPMLVVEQSDGDRYGYILIGPDGESAADTVAAHVAVPVQVSGELTQRGDLTYLELRTDSIERL